MTEPSAPEQTVDTAAVENLIQVLMKGLRAIQLYLPNNPIHQKAVENIRRAFEPVWEECADLILTVSETKFSWEGSPVHEWESKSDSIAWVLYKDGVRELTLLPGVEDGEIINLLDVIHRARGLTAEAADDLLTLLWEQDFEFVRYETIEVGEEDAAPLQPSPDGWRGTAAAAPEEIKEAVRQDAQDAAAPSGIVSVEDFDSTLYFLDETELKYLRHEFEREYHQDLKANVLAMVFDLLELQTYNTVRAELISIIENFIPYLLGVGDFHSVASVLRDLRVILERARELIPEHRSALNDLPERLSKADALDQLLQSLDEAVVHPTEEELNSLFGELRPEALERLLEWLPRLSNDHVRALLESAGVRLGQTHPDQVVRTLETAEGEVLEATLRLVATLKLPPFVPALGVLLKREDVTVRRVAAETLAAIASPGAMKELETAVEDQDQDVRIAAVKVLGERGHRGAFGRIEAAVSGRRLRNANLTEKKAFFEAYGQLAGLAGTELLRGMLLGKGLLKLKEGPETRACAAMALGKIGNEEARAALESVSGEKEPIVRNAVAHALRDSA